MGKIDELKYFINNETKNSYHLFGEELQSDENQDYRRGFLAGRLFAQLQLKAEIGELQDASTQQPTD